jgi:predicted tellurium resistance membrane protein TerC
MNIELTFDVFIYLLGLSAMEIVLGIDNIVFISIVTGRLPPEQQPRARQLGLGLALVLRVLLLLTLSWILALDEPIFYLSSLGVPEWVLREGGAEAAHEQAQQVGHWIDNGVSWKDLILLVGGLFLIGKSVHEIHAKMEGGDDHRAVRAQVSFRSVLVQIAILDIVFSLDSVITAVGMVPSDRLWVMVVAVILAVLVMLVFSGPVSGFVSRHPTLKMLALSFLILIGVMLVAEAIGTHVEKGYIYFAMSFALVVELLNLRVRSGHAAAT